MAELMLFILDNVPNAVRAGKNKLLKIPVDALMQICGDDRAHYGGISYEVSGI